MVGKEGRKKKEGRQAKHSWSEELEGGMRRHSLGVASTCGNFCEKMEKKKKKKRPVLQLHNHFKRSSYW